MSSLAIKRISADIKNIRRNYLDEQNIYVSVNEENIFKIKAMVIGPKDTPYENGFYFFGLFYALYLVSSKMLKRNYTKFFRMHVNMN